MADRKPLVWVGSTLADVQSFRAVRYSGAYSLEVLSAKQKPRMGERGAGSAFAGVSATASGFRCAASSVATASRFSVGTPG